jgi:RNA polymerase sigma-70 factor (ECF subfamily)
LGAGLRRYVAPEDVLQQAYAAAFKSIKRCSFDDPGRFYKWLERIALDQLKRVARDLHRAKRDVRRNQSRSPGGKTSIPDLVERVATSQSTPSRHLAKREAFAAAISSLARLTDDQRIAIQMRILEGRPAGEIATELGKTEGAVHMLVKRGLDKLAELMGSISRYISSR